MKRLILSVFHDDRRFFRRSVSVLIFEPLMLDALIQSGRVKSGQKILCVVPESGRAMIGFMMLEAM